VLNRNALHIAYTGLSAWDRYRQGCRPAIYPSGSTVLENELLMLFYVPFGVSRSSLL
jgi:hypothetical protein